MLVSVIDDKADRGQDFDGCPGQVGDGRGHGMFNSGGIAGAAADQVDDPGIIYPIESRPPPVRTVVLAVQHVLTMFGATVAVPLLLGPQMGMNQEQIAVLISSVMVCSGLATLLQATFGTRLPIIQGVSFSFLAAFMAIIAYGRARGLTPQWV